MIPLPTLPKSIHKFSLPLAPRPSAPFPLPSHSHSTRPPTATTYPTFHCRYTTTDCNHSFFFFFLSVTSFPCKSCFPPQVERKTQYVILALREHSQVENWIGIQYIEEGRKIIWKWSSKKIIHTPRFDHAITHK